MVEISNYLNGDNNSTEIGDIIELVSSDFHDIDLSFVRPSESNKYIKFKSNVDLSSVLFNIIENNKLETAVLPIVGSKNIKWYSKTINKGETLIALLESNAENPSVTFLGVAE